MIAAIDVHYTDEGTATVAAVVFAHFSDSVAYRTFTRHVSCVEDYVPGQFYRRELPCILSILEAIEEEIDTIIIDGYVELGNKPGLGMHLWKALNGKKKVMGVAKRHFRGSDAVRVARGRSRRPLYVTAAGIDPVSAAELIARMPGEHRLPALLKQADYLSKHGLPAKRTANTRE